MWLVVICMFLIASVLLLSSLYALVSTGVPVVRTPAEYLDEIVASASLQEGDTVVDAGCGDGRALQAFCSREGIRGRGYELNGPVWLAGLLRARFSESRRRVKVYWRNFFRSDFEDVDVVYCHLMPGVMERVGEKCLSEMQEGGRLISYLWEVPGWTPARVLKLGSREDPLYVYEIPPGSAAACPAKSANSTIESGSKT